MAELLTWKLIFSPPGFSEASWGLVLAELFPCASFRMKDDANMISRQQNAWPTKCRLILWGNILECPGRKQSSIGASFHDRFQGFSGSPGSLPLHSHPDSGLCFPQTSLLNLNYFFILPFLYVVIKSGIFQVFSTYIFFSILNP